MPERDPQDIARIEQLERELAELKRIVAELLERERQRKRQASPFARSKVKTDKKKAGDPSATRVPGGRGRITSTKRWKRASTGARTAAARFATSRNCFSTWWTCRR